MRYVLLYVVVEMIVLVAVASWIGIGPTLLVLVAGSMLGLWLARREGMRAAQALATAMQDRRVAHPELTDGMLVAVGGLLLFLPGLVTDVLGLLLVLPPTRALVRRRVVRAAELRAPGLRTARIRADGPVIEGEVVEDTPGGPHVPRSMIADAGRTASRPATSGTVIDGTVVEPGEDRA